MYSMQICVCARAVSRTLYFRQIQIADRSEKRDVRAIISKIYSPSSSLDGQRLLPRLGKWNDVVRFAVKLLGSRKKRRGKRKRERGMTARTWSNLFWRRCESRSIFITRRNFEPNEKSPRKDRSLIAMSLVTLAKGNGTSKRWRSEGIKLEEK